MNTVNSTMSIATDTLIIGGGVSGFLTAREFARTGRKVTIIDRAETGRESSWAGGGILLPIYPWRQKTAISDLVIPSIKRYPQLCDELLRATGKDAEWHACGLLSMRNPDIADAEAWCQARAIPCHRADAAQLQPFQAETNHPLWLPEIAQVRNPRLLQALRAEADLTGTRILEHCSVDRLNIRNRHLESVQAGELRISAEQTVICCGAWSSSLLAQWLPDAPKIEIQPVRGQMLLFAAQPDTLTHMALYHDHYLIPRRDGRILAGSTVEDAGFAKKTTEAAYRELYEFATRLLPGLKTYTVEQHWAGLRPGSPDGVPYIDRHPIIENLGINAGHFRNGLVMGPASARLISDLMLQRPTEINPLAYSFLR
jgi:glycine oxidase